METLVRCITILSNACMLNWNDNTKPHLFFSANILWDGRCKNQFSNDFVINFAKIIFFGSTLYPKQKTSFNACQK